MMAVTHRLGGLAFGMLAAQSLDIFVDDPTKAVVLIVGSVVGSLLPDIDNPKSFISRKFPPASWLVSFLQLIVRGIACLLPKKKEQYIRSVVAHRGITHSLSICIVIAVLLGIGSAFSNGNQIYIVFSVGLIIGIVSHIFLDMLAGGVPLFCPFWNKRIVLSRIKTGGIAEWIFRTTAVLIAVSGVINKILV